MDNFNHYSTNSSAESILNIVIGVMLVIGLIISVGLIALGIIAMTDSSAVDDIGSYSGAAVGLICIVMGVVNIIVTLIGWAMGKLWINISRNLFNINNKVDAIIYSLPNAGEQQEQVAE